MKSLYKVINKRIKPWIRFSNSVRNRDRAHHRHYYLVSKTVIWTKTRHARRRIIPIKVVNKRWFKARDTEFLPFAAAYDIEINKVYKAAIRRSTFRWRNY